MGNNEVSPFFCSAGQPPPGRGDGFPKRSFSPKPQAVTQIENKRIAFGSYLLPELPDPEPSAVDGNVMEQNHAFRRQLRQPRFKIVSNILVGMGAIDVKKIDRFIRKISDRFIERLGF